MWCRRWGSSPSQTSAGCERPSLAQSESSKNKQTLQTCRCLHQGRWQALTSTFGPFHFSVPDGSPTLPLSTPSTAPPPIKSVRQVAEVMKNCLRNISATMMMIMMAWFLSLRISCWRTAETFLLGAGVPEVRHHRLCSASSPMLLRSASLWLFNPQCADL